MSKLGKKAHNAANQASGAIVKVGARQGRVGMAVANAVSVVLFNRYVELCDDGLDCADPDHEHVEFKLR